MTDAAPASTAFLLAGLPGSGKSTFARALEQQGIIRLSVDERVIARHGLLGKDYPPSMHFALAAPILLQVREELADLVRTGCSVVLDHALDRRSDRDDYKALICANHGNWRLLYFKADRNILLSRLEHRYAAGGVGEVTAEMLDWMIANGQEPSGEGEGEGEGENRGEGERRPDDVLEETPEFLSETPEHDRLWFEQKPPRDFDF
jgi:predicted kinase